MSSLRHHLAQVIGEHTLHIVHFDKLANEIAAYLLDSGHTAELDSLMRDVMAYRADRGVIEATAISAHLLSERDITDVKAILKTEYSHAKTFTVDQQQEPDVMGGIKIDLPGEQLDLTVRAQVNKFKRLTTSGKGA